MGRGEGKKKKMVKNNYIRTTHKIADERLTIPSEGRPFYAPMKSK